jgi:hypothetical protein
MNIRLSFLRFLLGIALLLGASHASATIILSLSPGAQNAAPPQTVNLDLTISGLGDHASPSLGVFDLNFNFDSTKLAFTGYTLGSLLGTLGTAEVDDLSTVYVSGNTINLAELSYLSPSQLATLQPSGFTLATLSFQVTSLANTERTWVSFGANNLLSDANGDALLFSVSNAVIGNPVPETPALFLFGLGLTLLIRQRRLVWVRQTS